jgi:hypothetical protein
VSDQLQCSCTGFQSDTGYNLNFWTLMYCIKTDRCPAYLSDTVKHGSVCQSRLIQPAICRHSTVTCFRFRAYTGSHELRQTYGLSPGRKRGISLLPTFELYVKFKVYLCSTVRQQRRLVWPSLGIESGTKQLVIFRLGRLRKTVKLWDNCHSISRCTVGSSRWRLAAATLEARQSTCKLLR